VDKIKAFPTFVCQIYFSEIGQIMKVKWVANVPYIKDNPFKE